MNQHFGKHPCTTLSQATNLHANIHAVSTQASFMYKDRHATSRTHRPRMTSASPATSIHTHTDGRHTRHMHMHVSSNYSPSRFDTETRPRSMRESVWCWTRRDVGERRREYGGEASSHQQLYINQSRFNYQKWRKEWAKWDGREGGDELGGGGRRMKWVGGR